MKVPGEFEMFSGEYNDPYPTPTPEIKYVTHVMPCGIGLSVYFQVNSNI